MTAIIIENNPDYRDEINKLVSIYGKDIQVKGNLESISDALSLIQQEHPDIVFLDMEMVNDEMLELLRNKGELEISIVFTYCQSKQKATPLPYKSYECLTKPFSEPAFEYAVAKISKEVQRKRMKKNEGGTAGLNRESYGRDKIHISTNKGFHLVQMREVIRMAAEGSYTRIYLIDKTSFLASKNMKSFEQQVSGKPFFRIHHSSIVNINEIVSYVKNDGGYVVLSDGTKVSVARQRKSAFLKLISVL